ncbi:hypothetical protein ACTRW9_11090 [Nitrospina sp. 32_T5]|uniref:hypothetical protein n=1 Tax=unclassified Nitrospina TaxID=2638683 RepID=UPI003F9E20BB
MPTRNRKPRSLVVHMLILLWTFYFCVGFTFHYHPDYVHAHADELQPHDHTGHFHSHEVEGFAAAIHSGWDHHEAEESHHHSESAPGSDSETVQLELNKHSLVPVKLKVVAPLAVLLVLPQQDHRISWQPVQHDVPLSEVRHLPIALSGRAPPALLS